MNSLIVKRLNKEMGENWEIISAEDPKIQFVYNGIPLIVKLRDYPFAQQGTFVPVSIVSGRDETSAI